VRLKIETERESVRAGLKTRMLNISPETLKVLDQVGFHGFWNEKPTTNPLGSS